MADIPKNLLNELDNVARITVADGPRLIYETARQRVYSGEPPWPVANQQANGAKGVPVQPFTLIERFHSRNNINGVPKALADRKPILTSDDAANPQLPQAMGVDLVTLVAQVLTDPGVLPPLPQTDAGPPTLVNAANG